MKADSFERFYYEKVALGEGCGCSEQILTVRAVEERSRAPLGRGGLAAAVLARLAGMLRRRTRHRPRSSASGGPGVGNG